MRSLALAEVAIRRGWSVSIVGDIAVRSVQILHALLPEATIRTLPREHAETEVRSALSGAEIDVAHLDTYWGDFSDSGLGSVLVSNMQDGEFGVRQSTLAVDANLGAEFRFGTPDASISQIAGGRAALVRAQVRYERLRRKQPTGDAHRLLVVLGGTDPFAATPGVVAALEGIRNPLLVTVIDSNGAPAVVEAARQSPHAVRVVPFAEDLPALANAHDFVITAAGTSVLDFACMGIPMGLLCVTDNQIAGYRASIAEGIALPLGESSLSIAPQRVADLDALLRDRDALYQLGATGRSRVDGRGAERVVGAWETMLDTRGSSRPTDITGWAARPATVPDASILYAWRNDPETRSRSRSSAELSWDHHLEWVHQVLARDDRKLLVVERAGIPVGTVRWDHIDRNVWEVSITVAPSERGRGYGPMVLACGETALEASAPLLLVATIHQHNAASQRLFTRAGYLPDSPPDGRGYLVLAKQLVKQDPK